MNRSKSTCPSTAGSSQRGAILILVMLVLLVLSTVVLQIWFTAEVDKQVALYQKTSFPLKQAARGAFYKACSVLLDDLQSSAGEEDPDEETDASDDGGLGETPNEDDFGDGLGSGLGGGGGDEMGGSEDEDVDSLVDSWARPSEISMAFSSEVEVDILIRDEDGKFNILSILSEDEEFQEKSMERLVRVIDLFREGMRGDLGHGDAREIAGSLKDWMKGERKELHFPRPPVKTGPVRDDDEDERRPDDALDYPLTMEELVMCDAITKDVLFGYVDNRVRIPGLIEYITIYSNLVFDEPKGDEEEGEDTADSDDPFNSDGEDALQETPDGDSGSEGQEEVATETNNGLININTAPLPVLKSLIDDSELSYSIIDKIGEFRIKGIEKYLEHMEDTDWRDWDEERDDYFGDEDDDDRPSGFDDDEDEDFIFTNTTEVFERVEDYFDMQFNTKEDAKEEFSALVNVTSNVFTIYVVVKAANGLGEEVYRAVVWRRGGAAAATDLGSDNEYPTSMDEGEIITLVPLEPYAHPVPYKEGEEEELDEEYY